jgi:redox-sensitive bicupin YhaK (pirin superfamily)
MVGPFIFFDQMGPVQFVAGQGMDVRPHPHFGLATVSYLFDGPLMHRDGKGNALEITPGAMWNFVSSRRERIEQAKEDWKTGKFAPVPGETEFIPLPEI